MELEVHHIHMDKNRVESTVITDAKAEGRAEGVRQGQTQALLRLLTRRFGALPPETGAQILSASLPQIELWFDRALDAPNLDAVMR